MATRIIFPLVILMVSCAGSAFLLIEILMWVMGRLDDLTRPAKGRSWEVECQLASTLSVQADLEPTYLSEGRMGEPIEADQLGYPGTSVPLFQFSAQCEQPTPHVQVDVHAASE